MISPFNDKRFLSLYSAVAVIVGRWLKTGVCDVGNARWLSLRVLRREPSGMELLRIYSALLEVAERWKRGEGSKDSAVCWMWFQLADVFQSKASA